MSGAASIHPDHAGGLFRSHYQWLCQRLRGYLDSRASAEDIAAETFVELLTYPELASIREPRALLSVIARRLVFQCWRHHRLEQGYAEARRHESPGASASPEQRVQAAQALQQVEQLLDGLPGKVRETFLLARLHGLTYPQIALELGISRRSVSVYMDRASLRCHKVQRQWCN